MRCDKAMLMYDALNTFDLKRFRQGSMYYVDLEFYQMTQHQVMKYNLAFHVFDI